MLAQLWHAGAVAFAMPSLGSRWGFGRKAPKAKAKPKTAPKTCHKPVPPCLPRKDLGSRWGLRPAKSSRSQPSQPSKPRGSSKTAKADDPVKMVGPVDESEARHCARHVKTAAGKQCARCKPLGNFCSSQEFSYLYKTNMLIG